MIDERRASGTSTDPLGSRVLLEIAVDSVGDALAAVELGADRLELCSALDQHGLTPAVDLLREVTRSIRIPVMAMLRPRPGPFVLSAREVASVRAQALALLEAGASGLVFGALREDATIDVAACEHLLASSAGADLVFHRALDLTPDPGAAANALARLGFRRVLTAGMTHDETRAALGLGLAAGVTGPVASLPARLARLRALIRALGDRLEVIAGGGVRADHAIELVRVGCRQLHSSCRLAGGKALDRRSVLALRDRLDAGTRSTS